MTNWEIAKYLIDAKKAVDSLWYIAVNENKINCDIENKIESYRNNFYINAATVVDKFIENNKVDKKKLKKDNELIGKLFYYRDKHSAHKDEDFRDTDFKTHMDIVRECIDILKKVRKVCAETLPPNITLDFICYDSDLFRSIYNISKEREEKILYLKHPKYDKFYSNHLECLGLKEFNNTEKLREVKNKEEYYTLLKNGLTIAEGLQYRQDWCIKTNVLHNENIWVTMDKNKYRSLLMMIKLGYADIFGRFTSSKYVYERDVALIENAEKYSVYNLTINGDKIMNAINYYI